PVDLGGGRVLAQGVPGRPLGPRLDPAELPVLPRAHHSGVRGEFGYVEQPGGADAGRAREGRAPGRCPDVERPALWAVDEHGPAEVECSGVGLPLTALGPNRSVAHDADHGAVLATGPAAESQRDVVSQATHSSTGRLPPSPRSAAP